MAQASTEEQKRLLLRLSAIVFLAELAHGMLLYGIIPDQVLNRFPAQGLKLFGILPVKEEVAGLCLAAYTLAELLCKVPAGHWVDRRGSDVPLRVGLFLSLATVPLVLLSRSPEVMFLGSFLHGLGAAPIWPAVISAWTRDRSPQERGAIMGQILTGWMAGLGLGVIAGKFLVALSGRAELVATCAPLGMWLITLVAAVRGARLAGPPVPGEAVAGEPAAAEGLAARTLPRELRVMAVGLFIQNLSFGALILPFNFLAEKQLLLNSGQVGLLFLLGGGPAVLLMGPMGRLADRFGRRNAVIYSMFVVAPLIAVGPFLHYLQVDPWVRFALMVPGLLVAGAAYAFLLPAWHALALGRIPEQQRGRMLALLMSVEMAALAGGHVLGTPLYTKGHFAAPFVLAGVVFGLLALLYRLGFVLPPEVPEEPHRVDLDVGPSFNGRAVRPQEPAPGDPPPAPRSPRSPHSAG